MSGVHKHGLPRWLLIAAVATLLMAHGFVLAYAASYANLSMALTAALLLLVVVKHAGLFGVLYRWFRRRRLRGGAE